MSDEIRQHTLARLHTETMVAEAATKGSSAQIDALKERLKAGEKGDEQLVQAPANRGLLD